jgi:hypothetical protein
MKRIKGFKLFEASESTIQDVYSEFEERVRYLKDEFDYIEFETEIQRGTSSWMISLWIKSIKMNCPTKYQRHLETFKVSDILPHLNNLNLILAEYDMNLYHVISDSPNKPSKSGRDFNFKYDDVTRIYITWI